MSLNLSDEEILNAYARDKFAAEQYPFAPLAAADREVLAKLDPKPKHEPLPTRKPFVPSWLLQKKNKRRR